MHGNDERWRNVRVLLGIVAGLFTYLVFPGEVTPEIAGGLADIGHVTSPYILKGTAAVAVLMGVWWVFEALPLAATGLVPLVAFPLLGIAPLPATATPYASPTVFLFIGGFVLALAMQRWHLHRRIALRTVLTVGTRPDRLVLGFMLATGFITMWLANTATAVMMMPIGVSVLALVTSRGGGRESESDHSRSTLSEEQAGDVSGAERGVELSGPPASRPPAQPAASGADSSAPTPPPSNTPLSSARLPNHGLLDERSVANLGVCLVLGIAYSSSIGSIATLVGTPVNAMMRALLDENHGVHVGFGQWMLVGGPLAVTLLLLTWWVLTHVLFPPGTRELPGSRDLVAGELRALGRMGPEERRVAAVFVLAVAAWVLTPLVAPGGPVTDEVIAIAAAIVLFLVPSRRGGPPLMDWATARNIPLDILLLLGGGLALSMAFRVSGLSLWIGEHASLMAGLPSVVIVLVCVVLVIGLTQVTSNTAAAAAALPMVAGVALNTGVDVALLMVPATLAATCAFLLPVASPSIAVAYATGRVHVRQIVYAGLILVPASIVLITATVFGLAVPVLGIG